MVRTVKQPDQMPMGFMLPPTDWVTPSELPDLRRHNIIAIDIETRDKGLAAGRGPGWVYGEGHICGVAMAAGEQSVYAPVTHPDTKNFDRDSVVRWVRDHMDAPPAKVFHNAPYDLGWLQTDFGVKPPEAVHDTIAMAFMLDQDRMSYGLDSVCKSYGIEGKNERLLRDAADAMGCDPKSDMWRMPARFVGPYASKDAAATLELAGLLLTKLEAQDLLGAYQTEMELVPMVLAMRTRGVRIDSSRALQAKDQLTSLRDTALADLSQRLTIGRKLVIDDLRSPKFMEEIFTSESVPFPRTDKTGQGSFSSDWMERYDHWLPQLCTTALKMHDAGDKFLGNYILGYTHKGRIHPEIHRQKTDSGGTKTSRFSYSDPPLQQMPSRNPLIAQLIRGVFLPEDGEIWGAHDYSQQEFRLMVHFAAVCNMLGVEEAVEMYRNDPSTDFHDLAAELTKLPRRKAKDVNFAKAFGAGVPKFALMTGMTLQDAEDTMKRYDDLLPFISRLSEFCKNRASERGFIRMIDGARLHFQRWEPRWVDWKKITPEQRDMPMNPCSLEEARERINDPKHPWSGRLRRAFTHKAMNGLIQGSAARQTKKSMVECWKNGLLPLIQMHDELDFSHPMGEQGEREAKMVAEIMRDTVKLEVPNVVDSEFGVNWGAAAKRKDETGAVIYDASWDAATREARG